MFSSSTVNHKVYKSYKRQLSKKTDALKSYVKNEANFFSENENALKKNIFTEFYLHGTEHHDTGVGETSTEVETRLDGETSSPKSEPSPHSSPSSSEAKSKAKRVILNVGGVKHEVMWKCLEKWPNSRLGKIRFAKKIEDIIELCDDVNFLENEIFFDRHSSSFSAVLNFYRTGKLHVVEDICTFSFQEDLCYWGVDECFLEDCCNLKYQQKMDVILEEMKKEEDAEKEEEDLTEDHFGDCCPVLKKKLWDLMV